jgi:hypothetical protein
MRLLCEIFIIGALIYLGWEKPYTQWINELRGKREARRAVAAPAQPFNSSAAYTARPASDYQPFGRPASAALLTSPSPVLSAPRPASTVSGSWMWDSSHQSALDPPHKAATPPH